MTLLRIATAVALFAAVPALAQPVKSSARAGGATASGASPPASASASNAPAGTGTAASTPAAAATNAPAARRWPRSQAAASGAWSRPTTSCRA